ncbi:nuclease-related domain-containing protein [Niallia nealsonii]|uniref:NERD domain-containing protein n=1 Tax=Niallia nealsonii TaxID=115979 RepID=A0A2N0YXV3_9BACI|nr:nuclease-related domain-containing protein [Niallia nealsonii]PKG22089.1 hypothetical protein CWS01_19165 [Niallia nealsonii]
MIVKKLKIPESILQLEALLRRLPSNHSKFPLVKKELNMKLAGYQGEKNLLFPLSFIDDKKYSILHDLRLSDGNHYFQIDVLILSKKFALLLEVKNYAGELYFDTEFHQLIRKKEESTSALPYPLTQLKRIEF